MRHKKGVDVQSDDSKQVDTESTFRVFDMGRWKEAKICVSCGRQFTWRKKWERCWSEVKTCSDRCKHQRKEQRKQEQQ